MNLISIIKEIFTLIGEQNAFDIVPSDFDFKSNKYAIAIDIGSSITDYFERNEISLQIRIVGISTNKKDILSKATNIDEMFNLKSIDNWWITRNNPFINTYLDDDKFNVVLTYYINYLKRS